MGMTVSHQSGNTSHTGRLIMIPGVAQLLVCFFKRIRRQSTYVRSYQALFVFWGTSCAKPQEAGTALDSQGAFEKFESTCLVFSHLHPGLEGIWLESRSQQVVIGWSKERRRRVRTPVARLLLRLLLRGLQQGGYWADLLRTLLSQPLGGGPGRCGRMHGALLQLGWFSFAMLCWKGVTLKLQN